MNINEKEILISNLIRTKEDLEEFKSSNTFNIILEFILRLNKNVKGKSNNSPPLKKTKVCFFLFIYYIFNFY